MQGKSRQGKARQGCDRLKTASPSLLFENLRIALHDSGQQGLDIVLEVGILRLNGFDLILSVHGKGSWAKATGCKAPEKKE